MTIEEAVALVVGKRIVALRIIDSELDGVLALTFGDGMVLRMYDGGRDCCERRYMQTDDDLSLYIGATFLGAEVLEGPTTDQRGEVQETAFLHVRTSNGVLVLNTYNEHNGYYGGFRFQAEVI